MHEQRTWKARESEDSKVDCSTLLSKQVWLMLFCTDTVSRLPAEQCGQPEKRVKQRAEGCANKVVKDGCTSTKTGNFGANHTF